jgi:hypothetical protein
VLLIGVNVVAQRSEQGAITLLFGFGLVTGPRHPQRVPAAPVHLREQGMN